MKISRRRCAPLLTSVALMLACHGEDSRAKNSAATSASLPSSSPPIASPAAPPSPASAEVRRPTAQLYVRLPGAIQPLERADNFESPLDALLRERKLGQVRGGGSGVKTGGGIEYAGLDVDVYDVQTALPVVLQELRELKAPKGSTVEELRDDGPPIPHRVW